MDYHALKQEMQEYKVKAASLELGRREIIRKLQRIAMEEIVPQVAALLPARFSLDAGGTEVYCNREPLDSIPDTFSIFLRVFYDGKPIYIKIPPSNESHQIGDINRNPRLKEIADRYGLKDVIPLPEPAHG